MTKGNSSIEIDVPDQASDRAKAVIPAEVVPELANAFREITAISDLVTGEGEEGEEEVQLTDEEYVSKCLMEHARDVLRNYKRDKHLRELEEQVDDF